MNLNVEQKKLITASPGGAALIRGVAGSGKTTVAVYRAEFLLNHYCLSESDRVLVVTFNNTLVRYLRFLYDKVSVQEEDLSLFNPDRSQVDIATVDSLLHHYYYRYFERGKRRKIAYGSSGLKYQVIRNCIAELAKEFTDVNLMDPKNAAFLLGEIDWMRSCNYGELSEYQSVDRLGRQSTQQSVGPQRLRKNSRTRQAIFELMLALDARLEAEGHIDSRARDILVLKKLQEQPDPKYTHIIVDESQDMTRVQLEFLKALYKPSNYSSFLFVADTAQSIYPHSWLVRGRNFTSIGFDLQGRGNVLSKNYRTTTQIALAAYSLIEGTDIVEDENYVEPGLLDKQGDYPVYKHFTTEKAEAEFVAREIRGLMEEYLPEEIIVIARMNLQLETIQSQLEEKGLSCRLLKSSKVSFTDDCIKLLTIHSIKGLEFKIVFIVGINDSVIPYFPYADLDEDVQEITERKLLYVGMTRASERLYLSSSGKPSRFLSSIFPGYLRLSNTSRFSHLYSILPEGYQFQKKILNRFSKEEKVRQWLLRELQEKYNYPLSLLEVEYKVNSMSRTGSVDICVQVDREGQRAPYIFCETKPLGAPIGSGLEQLKSYLSNAKQCQYGLVTNGIEIVIIDASFRPIDDIPVFNRYMLADTMERYRFRDYRSNQDHIFNRDCNLTQEVFVETPTGSEALSGSQLKLVAAYEEIAAGKPVAVQGKSEVIFHLPVRWLRGRDNCYLLRVRGDSMVEAGIEDQDYVLIQEQSTADNRDIVAVVIDDEATLKRFVRMGNTVLLVPENPKYEPIQLSDNQARIVGVAIGLLKKERAG